LLLPGFAIYVLLLVLAARVAVRGVGRSVWLGPPALAIYEFHLPRLAFKLSWLPIVILVRDRDGDILVLPTVAANLIAAAMATVAALTAVSVTYRLAGVSVLPPPSTAKVLRLMAITPESAMDRAAKGSKVMAGDAIRRINGRLIEGLADAVRAVGAHRELELEVASAQGRVRRLRLSRGGDARFGLTVGQCRAWDMKWVRIWVVDRAGLIAAKGIGPGDYIGLKQPQGGAADLDYWVEQRRETPVTLLHLPRAMPPERAGPGQAREVTLPPDRDLSRSYWTSHPTRRYHPTTKEAAGLAVAALLLHASPHARLYTWDDDLTLWSSLDLVLLTLSWFVTMLAILEALVLVLYTVLRRWERAWSWSVMRTYRAATLGALVLGIAFAWLIYANQARLELWEYETWPALARVAWRIL
jgi:hypothetical protein